MGNDKMMCPHCGEETSVIKSQWDSHIWKTWGWCDYCKRPLITYKMPKEIKK